MKNLSGDITQKITITAPLSDEQNHSDIFGRTVSYIECILSSELLVRLTVQSLYLLMREYIAITRSMFKNQCNLRCVVFLRISQPFIEVVINTSLLRTEKKTDQLHLSPLVQTKANWNSKFARTDNLELLSSDLSRHSIQSYSSQKMRSI